MEDSDLRFSILDPQRCSMSRRVVVVGGGISGLAAAHRLIELRRERDIDLDILLLEAAARLGGVIATERVGDFIVEAGPDCFISEKPWALRLCERLDITSRLIPTNAKHQNVYVVRNGSLVLLPEGFLLLAPTRLWPLIRTALFSWRGKLRMALELLLPRGGGDGDESLASFVRRRFGREVLERVAQPLIGGIYAADPEELSLSATMPRFLEMERNSRSVIWALWKEHGQRLHSRQAGGGARWSLFVTPAGGLEELVDAIARRLPFGTVSFSHRVTRLQPGTVKKSWTVTVNGGKDLDADGVILATPAYASAQVLSSFAPELAAELKAIPYSSTVTVSLAYRNEDIPHGLNGFGLVAPAIESRSIIACTFSSVKYPGRAPQGSVLLRAFVGGALQPSLFEQDDRTMEDSVRHELRDLLGIAAPPLFCRVYRHPLSMPQYRVGHRERVRLIETLVTRFPALALAGNAYGGVGIADCIRSGEEAAERILAELKEFSGSSHAVRRASG
jgi:oxygen-dependent protoporphyrinogen oxidase